MEKTLRAINETKKTEVAARVRVAASFRQRLAGLLGTTSLPKGEGLWLRPCRSVHTFFMRYPIDVLYLNREGVVLYQRTLPPWRAGAWVPAGDGVLELPAGTARETATAVGDRIALRRDE